MSPKFIILASLFLSAAANATPNETPTGPATVYVVEVVDGAPHLATGGSVPSHAAVVPNEDRDVWTGRAATTEVNGVRVGDAFVVVGTEGAVVSCKVTGIDVLVRGANMEGFDLQAEGPSCGVPEPWARLDCGEGITNGLAVRVGVPVPLPYRPQPQVSDVAADNATQAVLGSKAWQGLLREAQERSGGLAVSDDLDLRSFTGPSGTFTAVEAVVYSGEGFAICGGADFLSRVIGVVDESGRVVVPFFRMDAVVGVEAATIETLIDADRDGIPEVWTHQFSFDGHQALLDQSGQERVVVDHPWCGCPC